MTPAEAIIIGFAALTALALFIPAWRSSRSSRRDEVRRAYRGRFQ